MEEEQKKKDAKTLAYVLLSDAGILALIIASIFVIKHFTQNKGEGDSFSTAYSSALTALKNTLANREASSWSRPTQMLSYESNEDGVEHSFSYVASLPSPNNVLIDGAPYTGSDVQDKIDEAYARYALYDCKDNIEGIITMLETRKSKLTTCTYQKTAQEEGYYKIDVSGMLNDAMTWHSLKLEFRAHMYSHETRNISGANSSITWTIG